MRLVFMLHRSLIKRLSIKDNLRACNFAIISLILSIKRVVSAFGLIHSRFATNTFPSWKLAQPFRYIAHNGEINTLQGNLNWLKTSEKAFQLSLFHQGGNGVVIADCQRWQQSDSACLDNMIELLTLYGRSLPHGNDDADT